MDPKQPRRARGRAVFWALVRWGMILAVQIALGAFGWLIDLFDVAEPADFGDLVIAGVVAVFLIMGPAMIELASAHARGVPLRWTILRGVGVLALGLGLGSVLRLSVVDNSAWASSEQLVLLTRYSWWTCAAALALLLLEALTALVRRIVVATAGAPAPPARWPGPAWAKWGAGVLAVLLLAGVAGPALGRAGWHIWKSTATSMAPVAAAGAVPAGGGGTREVIAVPYELRQTYGFSTQYRVALYDLATAELRWDRQIARGSALPAQEAIAVDAAGVYLRETAPGADQSAAVWRVLDPLTGDTLAEARTAAERDAAVPAGVRAEAAARDERVGDDGIESVFAETADGGTELIRVWRYGRARIVDPATGRPAGADAGLALRGYCCQQGAYTELTADDGALDPEAERQEIDGDRAEGAQEAADAAEPVRGGELLAIFPRALGTDDVLAETDGGRIALRSETSEAKLVLVVADRGGFTTAIVGDRGWIPWLR
ncbi:hypothetical protein MUN78_11990 [Leucobacter allii]|uniref:LigA protein n=1 Tax=Leucobacter allii TaxID=2932247 RepID=A0ABY4FI81_9MICO|nr:hypothetical protein [Leucobacter allii]UOQ56393.1 hypothetical protein MUN78_11990 [Leucobacter allii]